MIGSGLEYGQMHVPQQLSSMFRSATLSPSGREVQFRPGRVPPILVLMLLSDMVCLGLSLPVMPSLVSRMAHGEHSWVIWYGAATLAYGIAFLCSAGLTGSLSDRLGRRPLMLCNCVGLAVGNIAGALSPSLAVFVLSRGWCGFFSSNISLAQAYVADISTPAERGPRFGLLGAMQGLGFIVGPLLGGFLARIDLRAPFVMAGVAAAAIGTAAFFLLRESLVHGNPGTASPCAPKSMQALRQLLLLPRARTIVPAIVLLTLSQNITIVLWVPYATARYGWSALQNGWGLFIFGVASMASQALVFPLLIKAFSLRWICVAGLASSFVAYLAFGLTGHGWIACAVMIANMLGYTVYIGFQTLVAGLADERFRGTIMGGLQTLNNLSLVLAPAFSAALLFAMNASGGGWREGMPMYFCSFLALLSLVLYASSFRGGEGLDLPPTNEK